MKFIQINIFFYTFIYSNRNEEPSPFISEVQISEHILADEPGLGDEHLNFHLP